MQRSALMSPSRRAGCVRGNRWNMGISRIRVGDNSDNGD